MNNVMFERRVKNKIPNIFVCFWFLDSDSRFLISSSLPTGHVCHVLPALIKILKIETHGNSNYLCRSMILHTLNGSYAYFMDVAIDYMNSLDCCCLLSLKNGELEESTSVDRYDCQQRYIVACRLRGKYK